MTKRTRRLSALSMPEDKKQETLDAVMEAFHTLSDKAAEFRECWSEDFKVSSKQIIHTLTMINRAGKFLDTRISLCIGWSQPIHMKRFSRRSDIERLSRRIANETGADVHEVEHLFISHMSRYLSPNR